MNNPLVVLSLGAGVQSSTLALMAAQGEVTPMPDCAIFADTGWEPRAVYEWLDWLKLELPFPVYSVSNGNIRDDHISSETRSTMPFYSKGGQGKSMRKCTSDYKITPVEKKIRELLGLQKYQRWPSEHVVNQWFGISLDEIQRMRVSQRQAVKFVYPLVDKRMARHDCLNWMKRNGYPQPPRSACIGCPYHSDHEWREIKANRPDEWRDAVAFDSSIRRVGGMSEETFLHRQCVPLDQVDLSTAEDRGQLTMLDECEGMCGV